MRKHKFIEIINTKIGKKIKPKFDLRYQKNIREVLYKHRKIQQRKNQLRVDYVGLEAFGYEIKKENAFETCDIAIQQKEMEEEFKNEIKKTNFEGQFINKLHFVNKTLLNIISKLILMSDNYDIHIL